MSEEKDLEIDVIGFLITCLKRWRVFVIFVALSAIVGGVYIYITKPKYKISSRILIKDNRNRQSSILSQLQSIPFVSMGGGSNVSIENEMEILLSKTNISKIIYNLNLNVTYNKKKIVNEEVLKTTPFIIELAKEDAKLIKENIKLKLSYKQNGSIKLSLDKKDSSFDINTLPQIMITDYGKIIIRKNEKCSPEIFEKEYTAQVEIENISQGLLEDYRNNMSVYPTSKKTSVLELSMASSNVREGVSILNNIITEYNNNAEIEKTELIRQRLELLEEKLRNTSEELFEIDNKLEKYKRDNNITQIESDAKMLLSSNYEYKKTISENAINITVIEDILQQIKKNKFQPIPSGLIIGKEGINNSELIVGYNKLLIERENIIKTNSENHPYIPTLDQQIEISKKNLIGSLELTLKSIRTAQDELMKIEQNIVGKINNAPRIEREIFSLNRDKEIHTNMYLTLLKMTEESNMSLNVVEDKITVIDEPAQDGLFPIYPNKKSIMLGAVLIGLLLSILYIYIPQFFNQIRLRIKQEL